MRFVFLTLILSAACGHDHDEDQFVCDGDEDEAKAGAKVTGAEFEATLVEAKPSPQIVAENEFTLTLTDVASGSPVIGATFTKVEPFTKKHDHGTPIDPVVTELGNGQYKISDIHYVHRGPWYVHMDIEANGKSERLSYSFCIAEGPN